MTDNLSDKDKKDWKNFIESSDSLDIKDKDKSALHVFNSARTIDLHGHTLEEANIKINEYIMKCYSQNVTKINIITGKGLRSKNFDNPYQSSKLSILKYSVPNFIKNNKELMNIISKIDFDAVNSPSKGSFDIFLKKK